MFALPLADCAWQRILVPTVMGLQGRCYPNDGARDAPFLTRLDTDIGTAALAARGREIPGGSSRVEWSGHIEALASDEYTFFARTDRDLSLFVDGAPVLEGRAGGTEAEYWGLSYRQGLEWILRHDGRGAIKVFLAGGLAEASAAILPRGERRRLVCVARRGEADYFLGNYRWHRGDYPHRHSVYAVRVGDAEIMSVYDLRYERWGLRRGRWGERSPRRSA